MKCLLAAAALAVGLTAAATAPLSAQQFNEAAVKKSVTQADLLAVVGSLGHQVIEEGEAGEAFLVAQSEDEINYILIGTACDVNDVPGCQGIMMQVRYDLPPGTSLETLAKANMDQAALNTWADFGDNTLGFTRYVVLDYGVTMANIRENVNVLLALVFEAYPVASGEEDPDAAEISASAP
jgi:hypothetical protein